MTKAINIMDSIIITMDKKKGFKGALDIMLKTKADYIIITQKDKPIGIITERDILRELASRTKKVPNINIEDAMTKDMISIGLETDIAEISSIMEEEDIRHLPVIEGETMVGLIKAEDVFRETKSIQNSNIRFRRYQNLQTSIIVTFFIFLLIYFLYRVMVYLF